MLLETVPNAAAAVTGKADPLSDLYKDGVCVRFEHLKIAITWVNL